MRFTIRDLLWLTVVVALAVLLWIEHQRAQALHREVAAWREQMQNFVDMATQAAGLKVKWPLPDGSFMEPTKLPPKGGTAPPKSSAPAPNPPKN